MPKWLKSVLPQKLKYRLFMAFLLMILVPFSILNFYNYHRIEVVMQDKISEKSNDQLKQIIQTLEDLMSVAFKTRILLEQDTTVKNILSSPQDRSILDNKYMMEEKLKIINNSFFLYNPFVYYTIVDFHENIYTSYQPRKALNYDSLVSEKWFKKVMTEDVSLHWVTNEDNYVSPDLSSSTYLLSLYTLFKDRNYEAYGAARISIDYSYWFDSVLRQAPEGQDYFVITQQGETVVHPLLHKFLTDSAIERITADPDHGYFIDQTSESIINYSYIESLDWYMVNRVPLEILFNEIKSLKKQYFLTFFLLTAAFILMTFIIASTITRPLSHLQNKMRDAVDKSLKIRLPEDKYKGEILQLTKTFNTMLNDMNLLIQRLKEEERQKESVHFQMLLAQMNPHFLLNTLNTMKWIAIRKEDKDIEDMCVSLGKLLEASLNTEYDMVLLQEEMELTKAYVHIQQVRFKFKFTVQFEYDESVAYALVPKLSIQPLVENAIQHGISQITEKGLIQIRIYKDGLGNLIVEIEDNGVGVDVSSHSKASRKRPSIGIKNFRERLNLLFRDQGNLNIIPLKRGTLAKFTIPFLLSSPYEKEVIHDKTTQTGQ